MSKRTIPSPKKFLEQIGLYDDYEFTKSDVTGVIDLIYYAGTYDAHCVVCGKEATFRVSPLAKPVHLDGAILKKLALSTAQGLEPSAIAAGLYTLKAECARNAAHTQHHILLVQHLNVLDAQNRLVTKYHLQKIGQYPSTGDLGISKVKKYSSVLSKTQLAEFSRAIGLASHDVGVGAYVYLRRIFEALVEQAHEQAKGTKKWKESQYQKSRMSERITLLREHLPAFLTENPQMYSLLSKGVHELSEQECLDHFNTLRICIELILDEQLERREREQKMEAARSALSSAVNSVSK